MTDRPNILLIFPDQLGARWLPNYGHPSIKTPIIEQFASESVQFNRAYSNTPLCTPFRAILFSGQYASQTGVSENGMTLDKDQRCLAHELNDAGYATHYIGKWHLCGGEGNHWVPTESRNGFTSFIGWESHHVDHYAGKIWKDDPDNAIEWTEHETDGLTDIVCEELEALSDSDKPFFMTVSYQAPHAPSTPPEDYYDLYDSSVCDWPENTDGNAWFKQPSWSADYGVEEFRKRYFGEISHLDAAFGRVLECLDRNGLKDNTVVIFTSDHGEMAGCHGRFGKGVMFEESVRVPLLIRYPDRSCRRVDRPVSSIDLFPTVLDLAGVTVPASAEGRSLVGDLEGTDIYFEHREDAVLRGNIKLIVERDSESVIACYDLDDDPFELNDISNTLNDEIKADMLRSLCSWRSRIRN